MRKKERNEKRQRPEESVVKCEAFQKCKPTVCISVGRLLLPSVNMYFLYIQGINWIFMELFIKYFIKSVIFHCTT